MSEHDGTWQEATIKMVDGRQYIGALLWLDPNKRTSDMMNDGKAFLAILWDNDFYSINKAQILWVNEHTGMKNEFGQPRSRRRGDKI
jgi:hypothetical protein